ncbi:MAG TPA: TIR domain-containing protein [Lacunisphaera sp.]|nr:TIR domain-containing protein [Lacunisphaera sp.]
MSELPKAVFLSYASQDAEVAKRIADALRTCGIEVWFDQSELRGGDAWDQKIRRQIKECALFMPVISPNTNARPEGYFRLEWKLAVDRSHLMADDQPFLFPIVVGDIDDATARVPDKFRDVQWTRLRLDETPGELAARVTRLLSVGVGASLAEARGRAPGAPLQRKGAARWWWLLFPLLATPVAIIAIWKQSPPPERPMPPPPAAVSPDPKPQNPEPKPLTEARQLATRARALFVERLDTSRDDCALAEDLLKQALQKDPNDAEVWAALSHVHGYVVLRGWDMSNARRESARAAAQRAVRLDPTSFEGRLAEAFLLADTGSEAPEKERLLRALRAERPAEKRLLRALATVLDRRGELAEADAISAETAALPGGDPLSFYNQSLRHWFVGDTERAESAIGDALKQAPNFTGALIFTAWYAAILHGDLERARVTIDRVPAGEMREDRPAFFAWFIELLARRPDAAIARLQAVPRAWLEDNWYRGPKAMLVGDALEAGGRRAAAELEWRTALQQVEERLQQAPGNQRALFLRGILLAKLGERAEAERQFKVLVERNGIDLKGGGYTPPWVTEFLIQLGRAEEAIPQISRALQSERRAVDYTAATLRLDPRFDSIRKLPAFPRVVAEAEAIEQRAGQAAQPARNWPTDPELKKAFGIITGVDATAESCRLAEDMVNAILKQRPTDPEATTVYAMLNNYNLIRGYDLSEERYVLARRFSERALQLTPAEPEAMAAMAQVLTFRGTDYARGEELIRQAMARAPEEPRFGRILVYNVLRLTDPARALAQAKEDAARFPRDALTQYDLALICRGTGDLELMEQALDRTLAIAPVGSAQIWKGWLAAWVHGDLPGFKQWLDRIGGNFRLNERAVYMRYLYACLSGDTADGLEAVNSFPGSWMSDFYYTGPRALLEADLLARQGKVELARAEYDRALTEIRRFAEQHPGDSAWERAELFALLGAGRMEEAKATNQRQLQRLRRPVRPIIAQWWHDMIPAQLLVGNRAEALALIREAAVAPSVRSQIRVAFKIDHRMAPFRDDPEIKALLAEPAEKK